MLHPSHVRRIKNICFLLVLSNTIAFIAGLIILNFFRALATDAKFVFEDDLLPIDREVDVNIGTNLSPFEEREGRHRILVDPLFSVCEANSKIGPSVTSFCMAISNYSGFATFREYNTNGVSSSLSKVTSGTSHEHFSVVALRTVLVLEARVFFGALFQRNLTIERLKFDTQGNELTILRNMQDLLRTGRIRHIHAECFCPEQSTGKQIYEIDNSCYKVAELLIKSGYRAKFGDCSVLEYSDVDAYKYPAMEYISDWGD